MAARPNIPTANDPHLCPARLSLLVGRTGCSRLPSAGLVAAAVPEQTWPTTSSILGLQSTWAELSLLRRSSERGTLEFLSYSL